MTAEIRVYLDESGENVVLEIEEVGINAVTITMTAEGARDVADMIIEAARRADTD